MTQPALLSIWLRDPVKPTTLTRSLTLRTVGQGAGWQADRWCADNAVSLEQRTKALRAGQEIHLVEMGAGRRGGPDRKGIVEGERMVVVVMVVGGLYSSLHTYSWKPRDSIDPK